MENKGKHPKTPSAGDEITASNTQSTISASSEGSSIHDNPDYIPPNEQHIMLVDITSKVLHTTISGEMGFE